MKETLATTNVPILFRLTKLLKPQQLQAATTRNTVQVQLLHHQPLLRPLQTPARKTIFVLPLLATFPAANFAVSMNTLAIMIALTPATIDASLWEKLMTQSMTL